MKVLYLIMNSDRAIYELCVLRSLKQQVVEFGPGSTVRATLSHVRKAPIQC